MPLRRRHGFTLFEIMIVVAILGILVTMGVPLVNRIRHRAPLAQAVRDVFEVFSNARARAIMQGRMVEVYFNPLARTFAVSTAGAPALKPDDAESPPPDSPPPSPPNSGLSAQFSEKVTLEMLDVNLTEYKDQEIARVRFYPNGTSDEATLVLRSEKNEWIKISLETTTGLPTAGPVDR